MSNGPIMLYLFAVTLLKCERFAADTPDILFVDDQEVFRDAATFLGMVNRPQISSGTLEL
jgi:hypothetical protein